MAISDFEVVKLPTFERSRMFEIAESDVPFPAEQLEEIYRQTGFVHYLTVDMNAADQAGKARFPYLNYFMNIQLWGRRG